MLVFAVVEVAGVVAGITGCVSVPYVSVRSSDVLFRLGRNATSGVARTSAMPAVKVDPFCVERTRLAPAVALPFHPSSSPRMPARFLLIRVAVQDEPHVLTRQRHRRACRTLHRYRSPASTVSLPVATLSFWLVPRTGLPRRQHGEAPRRPQLLRIFASGTVISPAISLLKTMLSPTPRTSLPFNWSPLVKMRVSAAGAAGALVLRPAGQQRHAQGSTPTPAHPVHRSIVRYISRD